MFNLEILKDYKLCDRCIGRLYGKLLHLSNVERGKSLRIAKALELEKNLKENKISEDEKELLEILKKGYSEEECVWCKGIFNEEKFKKLLNKVIELIKDYEFDTFLVGTHLPDDVKDLETQLTEKYSYMESIKQEFGREFGKFLAKHIGKKPDREKPDIVIHINPYDEKVTLQINPLFIKGRYRKLVRGIPQTRWLCSYCRGRGCKYCNYTGKKYPTSVEQIIGDVVLKFANGLDYRFHGAGREDIDVRMLGNGRPFVIEIKEPKKRKLNLKEIEKLINKDGRVEVLNLEFGERKDKVLFKNTPHKKTYRAIVECEENVNEEDIKKIEEELKNRVIYQRTPRRVLHRRADLERVRKVYNVKAKKLNDKSLELEIFCDGGLYIKELISGDEGRTKPSVSSILNKKCICKKLDVLKIHDNE
ncbi:tRNA pseudouridine(54/55) synthase Pus10 [Methanocaldococcus indicus]|uniref:tRNA pseudouridine(54/55) synthase Pus10 n=1 Tax=Methanocaldococcus indicus TaxID=213231 RepID=UPI003C6D4524